MVQWLANSFFTIVLGLITLVLGYCARLAQEWARGSLQRRSLGQFFGIPDTPVTIVHGAIYDEGRKAFNFAAVDQEAAKLVADLFQQFHLREGKDYEIIYEPDPRSDAGEAVAELSSADTARYERLWKRNLVLIGGPRRNAVLDSLVPHLGTLPLQISLDRKSRKTILRHVKMEHQLTPSRDDSRKPDGDNYDYAIVASLPNPHNAQHRLVILAGVHGTGTIAAGRFVSKLDNIKLLNKQVRDGVIAEALKARFDPPKESPTDVDLC
jgi:hypothetical protein